jgi:hypothetical protein
MSIAFETAFENYGRFLRSLPVEDRSRWTTPMLYALFLRWRATKPGLRMTRVENEAPHEEWVDIGGESG